MYSLDPENKERYAQKEKQWEKIRLRTGDMTSREYAVTKDAMNRSFVDVTEEWLKNATPNSHEVVDLMEYTVDSVTYKVDGKHVLLDYKPNEKKIAELLEKELGGEIKMVPRILKPQGIKTPDYLLRGEKFDLKSPTGAGKNLVDGLLKGKDKQAHNFIIDISDCPLPMEEIENQVKNVYRSRNRSFVKTIIVVKNNSVLKVYSRY